VNCVTVITSASLRIDVAAGDGLEPGHDMGGDDDGIDALVRHGAMRAVAGHGDLEHVVGRHHGPIAHREPAHRQARPVVHPVDLVHGKALEQPLLHHHAPARLALFGRLEDEIGGAGEVAGLGQVAGGAEQHRGMAVMAAGMHLAGRPGGIGPVGLLVDVERVHVGAQADGAALVLALEHAHDAGAGEARAPPRCRSLPACRPRTATSGAPRRRSRGGRAGRAATRSSRPGTLRFFSLMAISCPPVVRSTQSTSSGLTRGPTGAALSPAYGCSGQARAHQSWWAIQHGRVTRRKVRLIRPPSSRRRDVPGMIRSMP
jgi:hypothetical protein